jgi:hypothetical protein
VDRLGLLVIGLLLAVTACSSGSPAPASPADATPGRAVPGEPAREAPYAVTREQVDHALAGVRPPPGYQVTLRCPPRVRANREHCKPPPLLMGATWLRGVLLTGEPIRDGQGLHESVRVIITRWTNAAGAVRAQRSENDRLRVFDGEYDVPIDYGIGNHYMPGERGRGRFETRTTRAWTGTSVRKRGHYVFVGLAPSWTAYAGNDTMRRGRYLIQVEWDGVGPNDRDRLARIVRTVIDRLPR